MIKKSLFFILFTSTITCKTIIWDLGGVLLKTNKFGIARNIGLRNIASYTVFDWKSPNIQDKLFKILDEIKIDNYNLDSKAVGHDGKVFPQILCAWQAGKLTSQDAKKLAVDHIDKLDAEDFFVSNREKKLIIQTINSMFSPEVLSKNTLIIPQGLNLLKKCAQAVDESGAPKHTLMILSNWDADSFKLVQEKFPDLFNIFDKKNIIISADIGLVKPQSEIFKFVIDKHNINPSDCIFIDDQEVNISAANNAQITGIQLKYKNYHNLRRELKQLEVF